MLRFIVGCISLALSFTARADFTYFAYSSTPGSFVGQGRTNYLVTPLTPWEFTGFTSQSQTFVSMRAANLVPNPPLSNSYWTLELEAPTGQTLQPGFYPSAARYPFNGDLPGLTLTGNHRGSNVISGYFNILEAVYNGTTLVRFAVDFRQHDNANPDNYVDGQWRFNSTIPEPVAIANILPCLFLLRKR